MFKHKEKILHHLLGIDSHRLLSSQNLLIIIDGVDQLEAANETGFEGFAWLPKVLPAYVRLILTANSASTEYCYFRVSLFLYWFYKKY